MQTSFLEAFERVKKLADNFEKNYSYYKSSKYQEAEVRKDFLDPFLTALGWDVNHEYQKNPYKQEVKVEKTQKQEGAKGKKFADYAFYLEPNYKYPVFFVEAKKPAVLLKDNTQYYLQTHKYGWNAQTPLSILTDFEEFIVIDCRSKPHPKYSANTAVKSYNFRDYKDENIFKEIYYLFSRAAVSDDSINHFVDTQIPKRKLKERQLKLFGGGYKAVDDDFLEYIDQLRLDLAKGFYAKNSKLTPKQLTEATQKTIDRLVFIRFLEDKQIEFEDYINELKDWKSFVQLSHALDGKYNGIVFKESVIDKSDFKGIDDDVFFDLCQDISSKESPYNFNVIPVHILGSIYERFLGKVVTIDNGQVDIQEKPEVRKAGGVFYTPKYVVDYIIKNSVGKIIRGKTPKEIDNLSFADISCGSGSFLIGVYEYLIDFHKNYYQEKLQDKTEIDGRSDDFSNVIFNEGAWMLSLKRKQDILLNNIFGVDIDNQAVEVSQLSLFLKLLEDESFGTTTQSGQITAFSKVLPDLTQNIRSGNSLVGWDIIINDTYSIEEQKEINPFDYKTSFSNIFRNGGFDAIVGNPPYVKEYTNREVFEIVKHSYLKDYYQGKMDLWYFFVCNGIDLLKPNGVLGYIVPNNWTTNAGASIMRNKIVNESQINEMVDFGSYMVFDSASIQTMILLLEKSDRNKSYTLQYLRLLNDDNKLENALGLLKRANHTNNYILKTKFVREKFIDEYILFGKKDVNSILGKIEKAKNFEFNESTEVAQGIVPNADKVNSRNIKSFTQSEIIENKITVGDGVFVINRGHFKGLNDLEKEFIKPVYEPYLLERYFINDYDKEMIYSTTNKSLLKNETPTLFKHLEKYKAIMEKRRENIAGSRKFFQQHWPRDEYFFKEGTKILSVRKCSEPTFIYTEKEAYVMMSFNIIKSKRIDLKYLIGILNSKLIKFWLLNKGKMQGSNFQIDKDPLLNIPIHKVKNKEDTNQMISLVENLIETIKQKHNSATSSDEDFYDRKIEIIENQINSLVYQFYDMNDEDIAVIETV